MTSWQARASITQMCLRRNKRFYADPDVMRKKLPRHQSAARARPPRSLSANFEVTENRVDAHSVPRALALFSPWIDLATDDPLSRAIDDRDPELGVTGLQQAGRWYAGDRAIDDPEISPAFADLTGLSPIVVFTGDRDILLPDARRIEELGEKAGVPVELHEYRGMFHNWIMKNIPEARRATDELVRFLDTVEKGTDDDRQDNR